MYNRYHIRIEINGKFHRFIWDVLATSKENAIEIAARYSGHDTNPFATFTAF